MKKVILAFDGQHFSEQVFEFARYLNNQSPITLTAVFLPAIGYVELLYSFAGMLSGPMYVTEVVKNSDDAMLKNIALFEDMCAKNNIRYQLLSDATTSPTQAVIDETRYADLLVLSGKSFYENLDDDTREEYIADVLHKAECPVVLIPDTFRLPDSIIMAYDGSEQAVFAIKQFTYLFPQLKGVRVLLAYFNKSSDSVPERSQIEDFLTAHYDLVTIFKLKITDKKDLEKWMEDNGDTLLVAGAHHRSMLSEMFRGSFINEVVHRHKVPVFVAHK